MGVGVGRKGASEGDERLLTAPTDNLIPQTKGTALEFLTTLCPPCLPKMEDTGLKSPWNKGAWEELGIRKAEQADSRVHGIIVKMEQMVRKKNLFSCSVINTVPSLTQRYPHPQPIYRECHCRDMVVRPLSVMAGQLSKSTQRKWLPYFRARGFDKGFVW